MFYLLVQMSLYLVCSCVLGLALGWTIQAGRHSRIQDDLERQIYEKNAEIRQLRSTPAESSLTLEKEVLPMVEEETIYIEQVDGIPKIFQDELKRSGIFNTRDLLKISRSPAQIVDLADELGVDEIMVTKWIRIADLMRVPGIKGETPGILQATGVTSVRKLSGQNPAELTSLLMAKIDSNSYQNVDAPDLLTVDRWVREAGRLEARAA